MIMKAYIGIRKIFLAIIYYSNVPEYIASFIQPKGSNNNSAFALLSLTEKLIDYLIVDICYLLHDSEKTDNKDFQQFFMDKLKIQQYLQKGKAKLREKSQNEAKERINKALNTRKVRRNSALIRADSQRSGGLMGMHKLRESGVLDEY